MTRRESREAAMMLIYERACSSPNGTADETEKMYATSLDLLGIKENEYIREVYFGVWENLDELDGKIAACAIEWSLDRMARVTLAILRLASYELFHMAAMPVGVTINEAVELAKKYDNEQAPSFINGILSKLAEDESIEKVNVPRGGRRS